MLALLAPGPAAAQAAPAAEEPVRGQPGVDFPVQPESMLSKSFTLAEEVQTYLWDIEHLAFVLGQDLSPVIRETIRDGRRDGMEKYLAPGFRARIFSGAGARFEKSLVAGEIWDAGYPVEELDRTAFIDTLVSWGAEYDEIGRIEMHTFYLSPDDYGDLSGGFELRIDVRITGLGADGSRSERRFDCSFHLSRLHKEIASESGWIDGFELLRARRIGAARPLLEEITGSTGIDVAALHDNWDQEGPPYVPVPGGARMLDYDRDGRVDLLFTDMNAERDLLLYRGLGDGRFEETTERVGLGMFGRMGRGIWITSSLVADLDDNGFPDLLLSVERATENGQVEHAIAVLRNRDGGSFEVVPEQTHDLGRRYHMSPRGMAAADYDGDGLVDLFLGPSGPPPPPEQRKVRWLDDHSSNDSVLLRNLGGFRFADVTVAAGIAGEHIDTSSATWLDLEPDGDADLFLGNHMGPNVLFENRGDGTFRKIPPSPGFGGFSMGAVAGDVDGDGDPDIYVANMYTSAGGRIIDNLRPRDYPEGAYELIRGFATGNELYRNDGSGQLEPLGTTVDVANSGWAYGPALIDLDGDGALDLYSPAGYQSVKRGEPDG